MRFGFFSITNMGRNRAAEDLNALHQDLDRMYDFRRDLVRGIEEYSEKGKNEWKLFDIKQTASVIGAKLILDKDWGMSFKKYFEIVIYGMELMKDFNEITTYFNNLEALPGLKHYEELVSTVELTPLDDSDIDIKEAFRELLLQWLISVYCSALAIQKNDVSLIFIGGQGVGKTTWLNRLCPKALKDYIYSQSIDPSNKDHQNYLSEKLFINLDDCLDSFFQRKGHDELKNFITAPDVDNRKAYARNATKRLRIASIMGSVNNKQFLTDIENRRYLCFEVKKTHWDKLTPELIDSVWREIKYQVVEAKASPAWNNKQKLLQAKINTHFTESTPEQEMLIRYFRKPKEGEPVLYMQQTDILNVLQTKTQYRIQSKNLSRALQRLDFDKVSKRLSGMNSSRYCYLVTPTEKDTFDFSQFQQE